MMINIHYSAASQSKAEVNLLPSHYTNTSAVETYFAYPEDKSTSKAILLITDVIGHKFINAQLIADQFAANGYFVVMPDLFQGDPVLMNGPADFSLQAWLTNHGTDKVDPVVEAALKELKALGAKKIGGVGYCFGGKYVARYLKKGQIDAGYSAHPSFVSDEELRGIEGPFSISAAGTFSQNSLLES